MKNKKNTLQLALINIKNIDDNILKILVILSICIIIIGIGLSAIVFLATGFIDKAFNFGFCLTSNCIQNFKAIYGSVLDILTTTGVMLGGLITLGAITVALLSYLSSNRALALANHISHMAIFSNYIYKEIEKKGRLNASSFDVLKWYNLIYSNQESGELIISKDYKIFILEINSQIQTSNKLITKESDGAYLYKPHQKSMKSILKKSGIELSALPRLDFHEVEGEVLELIDIINKSFCRSADNLEIEKRIYL
ncbi:MULTISPECIES: retron Ec48 family effector membrane protein [Pseudomonas]|uniref:Uncharacterized protein n=1 Tax=Pseudomonas reactans TaxID=117680 RepID=A0A7Y8KKD0_9PSED|nr:retron Ec48 family effector membrane protein [Pseudomonas reactans]NWE92741.1 hypothetical protein [Pseudomonas reactans]